jgi:hypothetical protein
VRLQAQLIEDQGGMAAMTAVRLIAVDRLTRLVWLGDMQWRSFKKWMRETQRSGAAIGKMYQLYLAPVDSGIMKFSAILGVEKKPPPQKTLEEILSESEEPEDQNG